MTVTFHKIYDPKQWDLLVSSVGGNSFHSSAWAYYNMSINQNYKPLYITYSVNHSDIKGIALGIEESSSYKIFNVFSKRIRLDSYPVVLNDDVEEFINFIQELENKVKDLGFVEIEIISFSSFKNISILDNIGYKTTSRLEFLINLEKSEDYIFRKMNSSRRRDINRAIKNNVTILEISDRNGIMELRRLQEESRKRIIDRGGLNIIYNIDQSLKDPINVLIKNNVGHIYCAKWENQIHSAVLLVYYNGTVCHLLAGNSNIGMKIKSGSLLYWECFKHFKKIGAKYYNIGGCSYEALNKNSPEHGVFVYKSEYGGDCINCNSGIKILNIFKHNIYTAARKAYGPKK